MKLGEYINNTNSHDTVIKEEFKLSRNTNYRIKITDKKQLMKIIKERDVECLKSGKGDVDFNDLEVSTVEDMSNLFENTHFTSINVSSWNTSRVTNMDNMFWFAENLVSISDLSKWTVDSVTSMSGMFGNCQKLREVNGLDSWNTENVTKMNRMFFNDTELRTVNKVNNFKFDSMTNAESMFFNCTKLNSIGDISNWSFTAAVDSSNRVNLRKMFGNCKLLKNIGDTSVLTSNYYVDTKEIFKNSGLDSF